MGKDKRDAEILSGISVAPSVSCRMQISLFYLLKKIIRTI